MLHFNLFIFIIGGVMLEIKRSPARVTWHLCYNDIMVFCGSIAECKAMQTEFKRKYGV